MKRLFPNALWAISLWCVVALSGRAAQIERVELDPPEGHRIGDPIRFVVTFSAPQGVSPQLTLPLSDEDDIVWKTPSVKRLDGTAPDGEARWEATFAVQVFRMTPYSTPPLEIGVGTTALETESFTLTMETVRTGSDANLLKDDQPPVRLPSRWWVLPLLVAAVAFVVLAAAALYRRRRKTVRPDAPVEELSPERWIERELDALAKRSVADEEALRVLVADVTNVVREYLRRRTDFPATQRTTRETLHWLRRSLPEGAVRATEEMLTAADSVKFARAIPPETAALGYIERARSLARTLNGQLPERRVAATPSPQ